MTEDVERTFVIVSQRLGKSSARLYDRLAQLAPAVPVLRAAILNLLCGAYHDYRSDAPLPKGDLIRLLRHANGHTSEARWKLEELIAEIARGDFDEDEAEAKRWQDRMLRERTRPVPVSAVTPITDPPAKPLTSRQTDVLRWLVAYIEANVRPPTLDEIAKGVGVCRARAHELLKELQRANVATKIEGARGWIPTKAP